MSSSVEIPASDSAVAHPLEPLTADDRGRGRGAA